jgi:outer membrane protein assembly factor BamB
LIYAQSFQDLYAINASTGKVEWKRESDWQGTDLNQVGLDGSVYKFDYENSTILDERTVQVDITRYSAKGVVTTFTAIQARTLDTVENIPFYQTIHTVNTKGDFIILTNGGLLSLKSDGSHY